MIEHDGRACIYGAFVSVGTNDILTNDEYPILDVGRNIISEVNEFEIEFDDETTMNMSVQSEESIKLNGFELMNDVVAKGEGGFNVSSFMNEAISKGFKRAFGIVWSIPLVMDFWWWCIIGGEGKWSNNLKVGYSADTLIHLLHTDLPMCGSVGKVKVLRVFKMIEHDGIACIYGAFVSVGTNDILSNDEFLILDVGRNIILENFAIEFDDETRTNISVQREVSIKLNGFKLMNDVVAKGKGGFNVSSFMNEAISKGFKRAFSIVWSRPLVMDFWWWCIIGGEGKWSNNLKVGYSADTRIHLLQTDLPTCGSVDRSDSKIQ
nr:hypothetical protein [Tanacetum cinerariifolium]